MTGRISNFFSALSRANRVFPILASLVLLVGFKPLAATAQVTQNQPLNVFRAGPGTGQVTSVPAGINCGATCGANFSTGTMVTLAATASVGSTFAGWSGACAGAGACTVTMNAPLSVTATFTQAQPPPPPQNLPQCVCVPRDLPA